LTRKAQQNLLSKVVDVGTVSSATACACQCAIVLSPVCVATTITADAAERYNTAADIKAQVRCASGISSNHVT
jgi:hypothetical protein